MISHRVSSYYTQGQLTSICNILPIYSTKLAYNMWVCASFRNGKGIKIYSYYREGDDPHMMCSICGHRFATPRFGARGGRGWFHSLLTYMVYLLAFLSYSAGSKRICVRPSDPDTMANTAPEAIASSSGKNCQKLKRHLAMALGKSKSTNSGFSQCHHQISKLLFFLSNLLQ